MKQRYLTRLLPVVCLCGSAQAFSADEAVALGRALYHGHVNFAAGIEATSFGLPPENAACGSCHGAGGSGGREGGILIPPLRWQTLRTPRETSPAYPDGQAIATAIKQGLGRDGQPLAAAMPRFNLTDEENQALIAYLQRLGGEEDLAPGVTPTTIRLATIVPTSGDASTAGNAILAGERAVFAAINARGGVHGRRIELVALDSRKDLRAQIASLEGKVFALVGGLWNETLTPTEPVLERLHLSHIGTLVIREDNLPPSSWSADLLTPQIIQERVLTAALGECQNPKRLRVALRDPGRYQPDEAWLSVEAARESLLNQQRAGCIGYALGQAGQMQQAVPPGWRQLLVMPVPSSLFESPEEEGEKPLWRRLGYLAASLSVELLSRAGRHLHERSLLDELDTLNEWKPALDVSMVFRRDRRYAWDPTVVNITTPTYAVASDKQDNSKGE